MRGHTNIMAEHFLLGAVRAGARVQNIQLTTKQITPCNGCYSCFYKTPGRCPFDDDMPELINKFIHSDIVIFATPIYMDNVTSMMKIFIERLLPILEPHYQKAPDGCYRRASRLKKCPGFIVLSSCAMPERSNFQVMQTFFRRLARTMHTQIDAEIYCTASGLLLLSNQELRFRNVVNKYKQLLITAGSEFAKTGSVSSETAEKLRAPTIDADQYVSYANAMWDTILPVRVTSPVQKLHLTESALAFWTRMGGNN